jgi:hypothetical protein
MYLIIKLKPRIYINFAFNNTQSLKVVNKLNFNICFKEKY